MDLIALMYPVTFEMQADAMHVSFETQRAAIGSLISPDIRDQFLKGLGIVRGESQEKTGRKDIEPKKDVADLFIGIMSQMGVNIPVKKKKKGKAK